MAKLRTTPQKKDRSTKKIDTEVESTSKNTKSPVKKAKPSTSKQQTSPNKPSTLKQQSTPKKVATPKKAVPPKKAVSPKKKAKTSKKQSAEVDSGISSGEQQKNRLSKNSPSKSTLTKINKKSKTAISKTKNKTKRVSEIHWLKGLLQDEMISQLKKQNSISGIEARYPKSLTMRVDAGVEYAQYPFFNGKCSGYAKFSPGQKKANKKSVSHITFIVLMGTINVVSGKHYVEYNAGTVITIEKGVHYGLENRSNETCFLRFQTTNDTT